MVSVFGSLVRVLDDGPGGGSHGLISGEHHGVESLCLVTSRGAEVGRQGMV